MSRPFFLLAALLIAAPLSAHDFWLVPSSFCPADGERVSISLLVGEKLAGEPVQRRPSSKIDRFAALMQGGEVPVAGAPGSDPAGSFVAAAPGLIRVVYQGQPGSVALSARKFEQYLREEGLERIIDIRRKRGESAKDGRELFSRSSKSLIAVNGSGEGLDATAGLPLEIIAESNPYGSAREIAFRVEYQGKPLEGLLVAALNGDRSATARTDAQGRVRFDVTRTGLWMIKAVHMVEVSDHATADWHSIWASLTFERTR